jgi:riboflavin synthase
MFTGLVRQRGTLTEDPRPSGHGGVVLGVGLDAALAEELTIGASLAVSGVCLTVVEKTRGSVAVELSPETLSRTTLGRLARGSFVNLEPSLRVGDPMGGHWVQGHVDATTRVVGRRDLEDHREVSFHLPAELGGFVVEKGSLAVDGVSLTVAALAGESFTVALIPHTLEVTTLGFLDVGDAANLEVDILAKYVTRALSAAGLVPPQRPLGGRGGELQRPLGARGGELQSVVPRREE